MQSTHQKSWARDLPGKVDGRGHATTTQTQHTHTHPTTHTPNHTHTHTHKTKRRSEERTTRAEVRAGMIIAWQGGTQQAHRRQRRIGVGGPAHGMADWGGGGKWSSRIYNKIRKIVLHHNQRDSLPPFRDGLFSLGYHSTRKQQSGSSGSSGTNRAAARAHGPRRANQARKPHALTHTRTHAHTHAPVVAARP